MRRALAVSWLLAACTFPDFRAQELMQPLCSSQPAPGACGVGESCRADVDCASQACAGGVCVIQGCSDGARNRNETDVDCGGDECLRCLQGQNCLIDADCDRALCRSGVCQAPSCNDGILNQDETDVDCGHINGCLACQVNQACSVNGDCGVLACSHGRCEPATCADNLRNGDETAADCGGSCAPCAAGAACQVAADCASGVCAALTCAAATCDDGIENGSESHLDCGADCPNQCAFLEPCLTDQDCASQACLDSRCVPSGPTGAAISSDGWSATANATVPGSKTTNALDGDLETCWISGKQQEVGDWYQLDMLEPRAFFKLEILCPSLPHDVVDLFHVLISEDGATFKAVTEATSGSQHITLTFDEPQVARYIKLEALVDHPAYWRIDDVVVSE